MSKRPRTDWKALLPRAAEIVHGYDTGVSLRQLFYRLVAKQSLPNTTSAYKSLSKYTAKARREGWFPSLIDRGRAIHRYQTWNGPDGARHWLSKVYRRDRTEGQEWSVYFGVEKAGIVEQLLQWYGDMGTPILAFGGYASQTYLDEITAEVTNRGRRAVLVYAGDFDPSGIDIDRDLMARTEGCFAKVIRVALNWEQVEEYDLPPQMGKATDSRAQSFVEKYGKLIQVELDALPPDVLRELYSEAIKPFWDESAYQIVLDAEADERRGLVA